MFAFLYLVKKKLLFEEIQKLEVFSKNGALKNFTKLTVKHLCQSLIFNKVAGQSSTGVSCDFCEIFKNYYFCRTHPDDCFWRFSFCFHFRFQTLLFKYLGWFWWHFSLVHKISLDTFWNQTLNVAQNLGRKCTLPDH